jgi:CheY-like chemotaxis protein
MHKRTILVVDDTALFRDPLAASLRTAGYDAVCAANGEEALAAVAARRPDLILLDMSMPVMDGAGFLRALRARGDDGRIPVVVLSAASEQRVAFQAGALGAEDYLVKSRVSLAEMIGRVGDVLARVAGAAPAGADGVSAGRPPTPAPAPAPTLPPMTSDASAPSPQPPLATSTATAARASVAVAAPDPRLVHLMCPRKTCGWVMSVGPELRGTSVRCTHCGGPLRVPGTKGGATSPPPPGPGKVSRA